MIAARFATRSAADLAAASLSVTVSPAIGTQISVAPLGAPGSASQDGSFILVARVQVNEYARAERLIADHGGDVILSQRERLEGLETSSGQSGQTQAITPPDLAGGISATE